MVNCSLGCETQTWCWGTLFRVFILACGRWHVRRHTVGLKRTLPTTNGSVALSRGNTRVRKNTLTECTHEKCTPCNQVPIFSHNLYFIHGGFCPSVPIVIVFVKSRQAKWAAQEHGR